jgi:hypothetical protein
MRRALFIKAVHALFKPPGKNVGERVVYKRSFSTQGAKLSKQVFT